MTSSFQIRIRILSREVIDTSSEFERTLRKVTTDNNSRQICKQSVMKLPLAYSFQKMFFIGQNFNRVYMTYYFLELLIFF